MRQVVNRFIEEFLPLDEKVAVVEFSTTDSELSDLKTIEDDDDRQELTRILPSRAEGGTCIGCGIRLAVQVHMAISKYIRSNLMQ